MGETPCWLDAYQTIGKHLFVAYPTYAENPQQIIVIADTLNQAKILAERHWPDRELRVRRVRQLENAQIYE